MSEEYEEGFIGEVEIFHFENSRGALCKQARRYDEPKLLELSPEAITEFLYREGFDLSVEGAVLVKSFDWMGSWEDYYQELTDWINEGQIPEGEPRHPDEICYQTSFLRSPPLTQEGR